MASDSGFQDSVDKSREALRRSMADGHDAASVPHRPEPPPAAPVDERPRPAALHPFFRGLLETLPEPGSDWPSPNREQWLETARNIFALLYNEPGDTREPIPLRPRLPDARYGSDRLGA